MSARDRVDVEASHDAFGARLGSSYFELPVLSLAKDLIGRVLVTHSTDGLTAGRIVETEAYRGPEDLAAHSAGGRRTARTEAMFGEPGTVYMYLLYGMHWAFNVAAGPRDTPHAVLVRALEPLAGRELMSLRRARGATPRAGELCGGPGRLTQAMGLSRAHYGAALGEDPRVALHAGSPRPRAVKRSPRINIDYAGEWIAKPWRFYEQNNPHVSVRPR